MKLMILESIRSTFELYLNKHLSYDTHTHNILYLLHRILRNVMGDNYNFEVNDVWGNNGAKRSEAPANPQILDWDFTSNRVM